VAVLLTVSILAWMVMIIQVVRKHGFDEPLAVLFAVFAGAFGTFCVIIVWLGKSTPSPPHTSRISRE